MLEVRIRESELRMLQALPGQWQEAVRVGLSAAALHLLRAVKLASPVGVTSVLQTSWTVDPPTADAEPTVVIYTRPAAVHGMFVEYGTRPHWAPLPPLELWVRKKLGVPQPQSWGVARAVRWRIAQHGVRPQGFVQATLAAEADAVQDIFLRHGLAYLRGKGS